MSEDNTGLRKLAEEITFLRRLIYLQSAALDGLKQYILSKADDPKTAQEELGRIIQQAYDAQISKIEDHDPAYAASIDIRSELEEKEQSDWYFPLPPKPSEE